MEKTYNKTTSTIVKGCVAKKSGPVHPAEKTAKNAVYAKNYSSKKPCKQNNCGRTLAN